MAYFYFLVAKQLKKLLMSVRPFVRPDQLAISPLTFLNIQKYTHVYAHAHVCLWTNSHMFTIMFTYMFTFMFTSMFTKYLNMCLHWNALKFSWTNIILLLTLVFTLMFTLKFTHVLTIYFTDVYTNVYTYVYTDVYT